MKNVCNYPQHAPHVAVVEYENMKAAGIPHGCLKGTSTIRTMIDSEGCMTSTRKPGDLQS